MKTSYERLVLASENKTPTEIAAALGTTSANVGNWQARGVSKSGAMKAAEVFGVTMDWILTGKGEMRPTNTFGQAIYVAPDDNPALRIPYMNARGSCGDGSINDLVWSKGYMIKEPSWFEKYGVTNQQIATIKPPCFSANHIK